MKKIRYCYYLALALVLGCLTACSDSGEELGPDTPADGFCTLSIQIGASNNVETRAGDDENALAHEFMHELCVFVVSDGVIEKKLVTTDGTATPSNEALTTGNAYEWRSEEFTLPSGEKTIYAFANWSTVVEGQADGAWKAIIDKKEGEALSDADLNFAIDDPASQIQLEEGSDMKFIPMSVKQTLNLAVSQTARIELIRLVGRVNVTVTNDKVSSLTVTSFKMGSFADKVPLMQDGSVGTYNKEYQVEDEFTVGGNSSSSFNFYINETENNNQAFNIALVADGKNYSATTKTTNIPRNYILPLNLKISESDLNLVVTAYINPVGGYPVNVSTSNDLTSAATYNVTVPEGASFQVTGTIAGMTEGNGACVLSYYGAAEESASNIRIDATDKSWAHVASLSGLTGDNITSLTVSYQVNGVERASCRLNVTTEPLKDLDEYGIQTNGLYLRQWQAAPAWYEVVPLRMANPE